MPWVIGFTASWILFILLADRRKMKIYIRGGFITLIMSTIVDWGAQKLQLYEFTNLIIPWFDCSAFYKFGPSLTMGILYTQSVPLKKGIQFLNILVFTATYAAYEYLTVQTYAARYIHWSIFASIIVDLLIFASMTWFSLTFLRPKERV